MVKNNDQYQKKVSPYLLNANALYSFMNNEDMKFMEINSLVGNCEYIIIKEK